MQQQKTTTQEERKRKMLLVLPLFFLPFVLLLFYSLGGGHTSPSAAGQPIGINTTLPAPQLETKPSDKLSLYKQADQDAARLTNPALDPFAGDLFAATKADSAASPAAHAYGYHPGPPVEIYSPRKSDLAQNEAKVQARLAALQQAIDHADTANSRKVAMPPASLSAFPGLPLPPYPVTPADTPSRSPELDQLNSMLEKVLDVQHPERVNERLKAASEKDPSKVYRVTKAPPQLTDEWTQAAHATDSNYTIQSLRRRLSASSRFFELSEEEDDQGTPNTIQAVVHQSQTVVSGATIKLRLTDDIYIRGKLIPKGTFIYGICELSGERLKIHIDKIVSMTSVYPVSLSVYAPDGLEGIYIPGAISRDVSKQGTDQALQSMQLATMGQSLGAQAAASGMETVRNLLQKKVRLIRVTVKADQPVLLYPDRE